MEAKWVKSDIFIVKKLNCGEIFSKMVFLMVNMCGYPAMMPVSQLDFMLLTDISIVMCIMSTLIAIDVDLVH